jgi:flagellin
MTRINTNVSSLIAQGRLNKANSDLQTSLTRLSTGLKINSGKDDPAGLIASEALKSDITSLNKAISNTQRASQIVATADSALGQVSSLLNNVRGLVVEAGNKGALSESEIAANQLQIDSSLEAINRIARTTSFQGRKLLDGSLDFHTSAGSGYAAVQNLQINQANLGASNSLEVNVSISSAATQAQVAVEDITEQVTAAAATGSITLDKTVAAQGASSTLEITRTIAGNTSVAGDIDIDGAGGLRVFHLETKNETDAFNLGTVTVATTASGNFSSITTDGSGNVTVTLEEGKTLTEIAADLADHSDLDFIVDADDATDVDNTAAGSSAFDNLGAEASTQTAEIVVVSDDGGPANFDFNVSNSAPPYAVPTAALSGTTLNLTVGSGGNTSLQVIADAINGIGGFTATVSDPNSIGYFDPADHTTDTIDQVAAVAGSSQTATINLASATTGTAANGKTVTFTTDTVASPTVAVDVNGNLSVTVSDSGSTTLASILQAINDEGTYTATAADGNTLTSFDGASDTSDTVDFEGGVTGVTGGISHDTVFEVLGKSGSEVFNVKAGTQIDDLINQINLVTDATGVQAAVDPDDDTKLILKSTEYGTDAFVDLRVISEDSAGTLTASIGAGTRTTGSDAIAKVNGVDASAKGNVLSINNSALSFSLTVAAGTSGNISFDINGGGAQFQLGGDLVINKPAWVLLI